MPGGSLSHMNMWLIATYFGGKVANYHGWWRGSFLRLELVRSKRCVGFDVVFRVVIGHRISAVRRAYRGWFFHDQRSASSSAGLAEICKQVYEVGRAARREPRR